MFSFGSKEPRDDDCRTLPVLGLGLQLFPPGASQPVKPRPSVVLGGTPFRRNGTFLLESQQDWIQRPLIDSENISADLLDSLSDPIAVQGLENIQRLEHHERQRSLSNVRVLHLYWVSHKTVTYLIWESNRTRL